MPVPSSPNQMKTIHFDMSQACTGKEQYSLWDRTYLVEIVVEPLDTQEKANKRPQGQRCQRDKISHHTTQPNEKQILRHDIEGQTRNQYGRTTAQHIKGCCS